MKNASTTSTIEIRIDSQSITGVEQTIKYNCGLKYMNYRVSIEYKLLELAINGEVTAQESLMLRLILLSTLIGHNTGSQDRALYELVLEDIAKTLKVEVKQVQKILASLKKKYLIVRGATHIQVDGRKIIKHLVEIGLNPYVFGELLSERQQRKTGAKKEHGEVEKGLGGGQKREDVDPNFPQLACKSTESKEKKSSRASSRAFSRAFSRQTFDKTDWICVKGELLKQFPNDDARLEGTYKQICERGFEREGKDPYMPNCVPAWLLTSYKDIREDYAHHDRRIH